MGLTGPQVQCSAAATADDAAAPFVGKQCPPAAFSCDLFERCLPYPTAMMLLCTAACSLSGPPYPVLA